MVPIYSVPISRLRTVGKKTKWHTHVSLVSDRLRHLLHALDILTRTHTCAHAQTHVQFLKLSLSLSLSLSLPGRRLTLEQTGSHGRHGLCHGPSPVTAGKGTCQCGLSVSRGTHWVRRVWLGGARYETFTNQPHPARRSLRRCRRSSGRCSAGMICTCRQSPATSGLDC